MKKFLILFVMSMFLFASANDDINKKLDELIGVVMQLKKQNESQEARIKRLEEALKIQQAQNKKIEKKIKTVSSANQCRDIEVSNFTDSFTDGMIPYYDLSFDLKNPYSKEIVFIEGNLFAEDSDGVKILQDFVKRDVSIKPGEKTAIHKKHIINNDLEKYLKDENPENLRIYFKAIKIKFADGKILECN